MPRRVSLCLMLLALLFSMAAPRRAAPQSASRPQLLVETVIIEGNRRLTDEEIYSHIKTRPGEVYDPQQVRRDLQTLLDLGVFDKAKTYVNIRAGVRGGRVVSFTVKELPVIREVKFTGLRGVTEEEVFRAFRQGGVRMAKGEVYDSRQAQRAVGVLKKLLRGRGQPGADVTTYTEVGQTDISVEFKIAEGQ